MAEKDWFKDEWRDFEKRFRSGVECVTEHEDLEEFPREVREVVENKMRERYRRYEREDHEDRSTPGYDFYDKATQSRYLTRVEFMLDDLYNLEAQPQRRAVREEPEKIWERWRERESNLGRRPDSLEKIYGWAEGQNHQVDKLREAIESKAKARQGRERDDGRER